MALTRVQFAKFVAKTVEGRTVGVIAFGYRPSGTDVLDIGDSPTDPAHWMYTTDEFPGRSVERLGKGKYRIRDDGTELSSDDPAAP